VAATVTKLESQRGRQQPSTAGGPTVRAAIDTFLDSPNVRATPNTLRAYTSVLDRVGEEIGTRRRLAEVLDDEIAGALTELWGDAKPATWNRLGQRDHGQDRAQEPAVGTALRQARPRRPRSHRNAIEPPPVRLTLPASRVPAKSPAQPGMNTLV
jgi:hypothetical protein